MRTKVKCKKDLYHEDGTKSFTKGNEYEGNTATILEAVTLTNDNGEPHRIGNWVKHFKIVK